MCFQRYLHLSDHGRTIVRAGYYLITWQILKVSTIPSVLERMFCRVHSFLLFFPPTNLRKPDEGQGVEGEREVVEGLCMNVHALFLFHL